MTESSPRVRRPIRLSTTVRCLPLVSCITLYLVGCGGSVDSGTASPTATYTLSATVTCHNGPRAAYVANYNGNTVSQYTVSAANGTLLAITPATASTGLNPRSVAVDPTGRYAYVANYGSNTVSQFTIGAGGALTPMATAFLATGIQPIRVVLR